MRPPLDREEYDRWSEEGERALAGARLQADAGLQNWAYFAAEQAAQLAAAAGLEVPPEVADTLRRLGRHYIPARYPDAHAAGSAGAHYSRSDADEAIRDAERLLEFVRASWAALGD